MAQDDPEARAGLLRLATSVASPTTPTQRPSTMAKTAALCRLIGPLDRYEDIAARHPDLGPTHKIQAKLWRLRAVVPGLPRRVCLSPYHIAQAYLASIPEHYRRSTEP